MRVYIEDTDSGGIVYYANYLRFMERARTEYLRALGIEQSTFASESGLAFVVKSVEIDYRSPALLDDQIDVSVELIEQRRASLLFSQTITRKGDNPDKPLCTGRVRIACLNQATGRPVSVPSAVIEASTP